MTQVTVRRKDADGGKSYDATRDPKSKEYAGPMMASPLPEAASSRAIWEYRKEGFVNVGSGEVKDSLFIRIRDGHPIRTLRGDSGERLCWSENGVKPFVNTPQETVRCEACPRVSELSTYEKYHKDAFAGNRIGDLAMIMGAFKGDCQFGYELHWTDQYSVDIDALKPDEVPADSVLILPRASVMAMWDEREPSSYKRRLNALGLGFQGVVTRIYFNGSFPDFEAVANLVQPQLAKPAGLPEVSAAPKGAPAAVTAALDPKTPAEFEPVPPADVKARYAAKLESLGSMATAVVLGILGVKSIAEVVDADLPKMCFVVEEAEKSMAPKAQ